uniref:Uncharacterized protein n=1 Tax=Panagrolaimus sp. JU765 TaxID=591449 RepID=A0AC34RFP4_9BILA
MGDDTNVFNTFSFKKWSERLKEKKIEDESQRQRLEQVARLKDKLRRERELRDQADLLTDSDIEKLIEYLNAGNSLTAVPFDPSMLPPGAYPPPPGYGGDRPRSMNVTKSDDEILAEIMSFYKTNPDHNIGVIPDAMASNPIARDWDHNRRFGEFGVNHQAKLFQGIETPNFLRDFEYNRKVGAK